jgi:hypothetical protein
MIWRLDDNKYFSNVINNYIITDLIRIYDVLQSVQNQKRAHRCLSAQMLNWDLQNKKQECPPPNNDLRVVAERTSLIIVCPSLQVDKSHFVNLSF